MGNSDSSVPDWSDQVWNRNIKSLFDSTKITEPLNFNADYLFRLVPIPTKPFKKKKNLFIRFEDHKMKNYQSHVFAFVSKEGEFTVLSSILPDILYHSKLEDTQISSVSQFHPNSLLISATNRNSIIIATFEYTNEDSPSDSTYFCESKIDFREIKGIESPQLVEAIDKDSFLVCNSSSIYTFNLNDPDGQFKKFIDLPQKSEPLCLSYFDGFVSLSTDSGLLVGKIRQSKVQRSENPGENEVSCSLYYPDLSSTHHLTFVRVSSLCVLLFFISSGGCSVSYVKIDDMMKCDVKNAQLLISVEEPVEVYATDGKDEVFVTDLMRPEAKSGRSKDDDSASKTVIFSCGREIFSFTVSLSSSGNSNKVNSIFLREKLMSIPLNVHVQIQPKETQPNAAISGETKILTKLNAVVRLFQTAEPRVFVAVMVDGSIVVCRHPPFNAASGSKEGSAIENSLLFNYHRCLPRLACIADEFSFLTFDENHVAILWENFPEWWKAPFYMKMFGDIETDDESNSENEEEEKNDNE